jgi:hypothetical protein
VSRGFWISIKKKWHDFTKNVEEQMAKHRHIMTTWMKLGYRLSKNQALFKHLNIRKNISSVTSWEAGKKIMTLKQHLIDVFLMTTMEKQENYGTDAQVVNMGARWLLV